VLAGILLVTVLVSLLGSSGGCVDVFSTSGEFVFSGLTIVQIY
jgi:hypothetical protein